MKKYILALIILTLTFLEKTKAENNKFAFSLIPETILAKANAVIRENNVSVNVFASGNAECTYNLAITIIDEAGEKYGYFVEPYDKFSSISDIKAEILDKEGKRIRKIKSDEIFDFSAITSFSIYDDNRVKVINPKVGNYPYTVVYEFKKKIKNSFIYPGWNLYRGFNIAVQNSSYKLTLEPAAKVKFKQNNKLIVTPKTSDINGVKTFLWEINNLPAIEKEPLSLGIQELSPTLMVAPENFNMDGYEGSNLSWISLGNWIYTLGKNKSNLPDVTKDYIRKITADAKSDYEKAKILYEYLQNKVRYVSIQLGIGGFQPFPAETVDRLSYGDCKALTNYMKSLLEVVGINSYYCVVKAGNDATPIDKDFVCSQFNHVFLMLPLNSDTLYLECTSQQVPFGYNGTFTDDRDILVIDSLGSYIKRTNVYNKDKNKIVNNFVFNISSDLKSEVFQTSKYIGVASEDFRYIKELKPEKQREIFLKRVGLRNVKISNINYIESRDIIPVITEKVQFSVPQIAQVSNKSVLIPINQVTNNEELPRLSERKSQIYIPRSQMQIDTIKYNFPQNIIVDRIPNSNNFSTEFGAYSLEFVHEKQSNAIVIIRTVEWNKGMYSPEKYQDLLKHYRKIKELDRQIMMLSLN